MSGKRGQQSLKATDIETRYDAKFMEDLDGRSLVARALRQRLGELTADLGGWDALSYPERSLCQRMVHLERLIESKELTLAQGRRVDENKYVNAVCCLSGLFSKIGLKARRKVVTLNEYIEAKKATPATPTPKAAVVQEEPDEHH